MQRKELCVVYRIMNLAKCPNVSGQQDLDKNLACWLKVAVIFTHCTDANGSAVSKLTVLDTATFVQCYTNILLYGTQYCFTVH